MRLNQSYKIRLYIMSIALLGSFFFMVYLGVNLWQAKSSEHKISELESIHYPIIENLVLLKDDLDEIREGLTSAIILENEFLIDEALELGPNFQLRLDTVRSLIAASDDQASLKALEVINDGFQEYLKSAGRLASRLVNNDDGLELYEEIANRTHQLYAQLNAAISQLLNDKQEDYGVHLHQIHSTLETTNNVAAIVGFIFVLGLIAFTWTITRLVVKAVNRADRVKESFLMTIGHELRTPMNGVTGALSLLRDSSLTSLQGELVKAAEDSSDNMIRIVDDILTLTELMAQKPKHVMSEFTQNEWLSDLLKDARHNCRLKFLDFQFDSNLNDLLITNDQKKLTIICRQLVENAVKYTFRGEVKFSASFETNQSESQLEQLLKSKEPFEGQLCIRVEDSGPGLGEEFMEDIFQPFSQEDASFNRSNQGVGIGLALSYLLVKYLGGRLTIENKKDSSGAVASFSIPTSFCSLASDAVKDSSVKTLKRQGSASVMVVEDNQVNAMILKKYMEKMNCSVILAGNGKEAVDLIQTNDVDLIIMDCQMPVMDGFQATEEIRALTSDKASVPVIAVTANVRDEDRERCFDVGMNSFLSKPVKFDDLSNAVNDFLYIEEAPH